MNGTAIIPPILFFFFVCVMEAAQPIKTRQLAAASEQKFLFSSSLLFKQHLFFSFHSLVHLLLLSLHFLSFFGHKFPNLDASIEQKEPELKTNIPASDLVAQQ
jgi:hypothetical protein